MNRTAAVITVSDRCSRGERPDTSGPAVCALLKDAGWNVVHTAVVPDEEEEIKKELLLCADAKGITLVLTAGGTGFSPRDVTPEATLAVIGRETRGIPEAMRAASVKETPRGCLSRAVAGIRGGTLIVNLPGSERAARENLMAVLESVCHGAEMLCSPGSADCAVPASKSFPPSVDEWLRQAKAAPDADKVGMYLTHSGVVRSTARAQVRQGTPQAPVTGMLFSCDREEVDRAVADTYKADGVYHVRVWLNEGRLDVGDDIMRVLIGADTRGHALEALQFLVGRIKSRCVTETELN